MSRTKTTKKETTFQYIKILCAQFQKLVTQGKIEVTLAESMKFFDSAISGWVGDLNEAQIRQSFILPLIASLGWNVEDPFEVFPEERINGGFIDIRLRLPSGESLIWEIKRASVVLDLGNDEGKEAAYQGVGYARTFTNFPYCVVTNFEITHIFHSYSLPERERIVDNLVASFTWFDLRSGAADEILNSLSHQSLASGACRNYFDQAVKDKKLLRSRRPLEDRILEDLERWRLVIAGELSRVSSEKDLRKIDISTQVLINRLIFIRCCEDRKIESEAKIRNLLGTQNIWRTMTTSIFPYYKASYNSDLFGGDLLIDNPNLKFNDRKLSEILAQTFSGSGKYTHEVYDFSIIPLEILGAAYESYLAKEIIKSGRTFKLELKPELKKSGGICYTPSFVVEEIIRRTVGKMPHIKSKKFLPKVLDPACGSGTFLIQTLRFIIEKNRPEPKKKSERKRILSLKEKREILENCIYGVDLDPKAVEITKLSLICLLLEGEQEGFLIKRALLPFLDKNIRCGNSLISPEAALKHLKEPDLEKLHPLDWHSFKRTASASLGFDVVLGNPPYVRIQVLQEFYPNEAVVYCKEFVTAQEGNVDEYVPFLEQAIRLVKTGGYVGYIVPSRFWTNDYGRTLRKQIYENRFLNETINFRAEQVFKGVTTYTCILILRRSKNHSFNLYEPVEKQVGAEACILQIGKNPNSFVKRLDVSVLKEDPWLLAPKEVRKRIQALERSPKKLRDVINDGSGVFQGLISGKDSVFLLELGGKTLFSSELNKEIDLEDTYLNPILKGSLNLKRFHQPNVDLKLLYPYEQDKKGKAVLVDFDDLKRKAPKTATYLKDVEMALRFRSALKTKSEREADLKENPKKFKDPADGTKLKWYYDESDFYKFSRNQALDCVHKKKLIVPAIFKEPVFFWDEKGEFALTGSGAGGGGAYAMYLRSEFEPFAKALVGILSSNVLYEWFERRGDLFANYYIGVDEKILEKTPIPDLTDKSIHGDLRLLEKMVDEIFAASDESLITELLGSIDDVVRKLYELTG